MKSLNDIALPITEEEYRADGTMHYSTITTFERGGFYSIPTLFERKESPSLLFGSVLDCMITGTDAEFESLYYVADCPELVDKIASVVKALWGLYKTEYFSIYDIPDTVIIATLDEVDYGKSWKRETRVNKIKNEACNEYYTLLTIAADKTLIPSAVYNDAMKCAAALHDSPATGPLFAPNNPFDGIERLYQIKFRSYVKKLGEGEYDIISDNTPTVNAELLKQEYVPFTSMMDLVYVDHNKKIILPVDLKTSSHYEAEFEKSFIDWQYSYQARSYIHNLCSALEKDDYFKDFKVLNYHFVVVNKKTCTPLVWEYEDTFDMNTLYYGRNNQIVCRHPFEAGIELNYYLTHPEVTIPLGVFINKPNSLTKKLKNL